MQRQRYQWQTSGGSQSWRTPPTWRREVQTKKRAAAHIREMTEADATATVAPMAAADIVRATRSAMPLNHSRVEVGEVVGKRVARSFQVVGHQVAPQHTPKCVISMMGISENRNMTNAAAESVMLITFLDPSADIGGRSSIRSISRHLIGEVATMGAIVGAHNQRSANTVATLLVFPAQCRLRNELHVLAGHRPPQMASWR